MGGERRVIVPAGMGRALGVPAGARVAVVDVEGGQVGDLFAFNAADTKEFASASHTRAMTRKLFPRPGDAIYSSHRRPMLDVEEDNSPGSHDTLYAACDPPRYLILGVAGPHRSCASNLVEAMADFGDLQVPVPQPFNVFMDVRVDADGGLAIRPASSRPGDRIVLRCAMDLIVVLSSCPMDVIDISTGGVTDLAIEVL